MLNIYIYKKIDGMTHIPILDYYFGSSSFGKNRAGDSTLKLFNKQFFNLVETPENSDYFLIPHNFFYINNKRYLADFVTLSKKHKKKILVFCYGDSDADINIPNSIIFRTSQYEYKKKPNEIIMPAIADDLLEGRELTFRKKGDKPVVGFCGWADYGSFHRQVVENIKKFILLVKSIVLDKNFFFHIRGIMFRIKIINILTRSKFISTNFIVRDSFSGNEKTRKLSMENARVEYVENILNSDLSLAIKGDGNFSIRFYEILSLGRIPVLLDTNCILPLEDVVDYKSFILRIDISDIQNTSEIISDFYRSLNFDDFVRKQKNSRDAFSNFLRADKYFEYVLTKDFIKKYE